MTDPNQTLTGRAAATIKETNASLSDVPITTERIERKLTDTIVGFLVAVFGTALTAVGLYMLATTKPFTVWLLAPIGLGVFVVFAGGIQVSKDLAGSFRSAATTVAALVRAIMGKNGNGAASP